MQEDEREEEPAEKRDGRLEEMRRHQFVFG
jgi:hypothetical protein